MPAAAHPRQSLVSETRDWRGWAATDHRVSQSEKITSFYDHLGLRCTRECATEHLRTEFTLHLQLDAT